MRELSADQERAKIPPVCPCSAVDNSLILSPVLASYRKIYFIGDIDYVSSQSKTDKNKMSAAANSVLTLPFRRIRLRQTCHRWY